MTFLRLIILSFFITISGFIYSQNYALGHAASNGNLSKVKRLINEGADVNSIGYGKWTPLTVAIKYKKIEVVKYLIEIGANVNKQSDMKWTPLTIAARSNLREIVQLLIEKGAVVDKPDGFDHTPMYYAVKIRNDDIISILEKNKHIDIDLSFFTTPELKEMYMEAILKNDADKIDFIKNELDKRTKQ